MKLNDSCLYEFPCLMIGKRSPWSGVVFLMAVNEVDRKDSFVNAFVVRLAGNSLKSNRHSLGDNYGFSSEDVIENFEPYHGQVIIHSEELEVNYARRE